VNPQLTDGPPPVTNAEALRLARDVFGLDVSAVRQLPSERDRNFHLRDVEGRRFVLKVVHPGEDPAVTDFQTRALLHVAESDPSLPVPRIVPPVRNGSGVLAEVPADSSYYLRCVTFVAGRRLARTAAGVALWRNLGGFLARLDKALTDFRHPAEDHELLWDLKRADRARDLLQAIAERDERVLVEGVLEQFAEEVQPRFSALRAQVIHNDFNPHNVLVSTVDRHHVAGVIDFGDAIRAPLTQELAIASSYQIAGSGHPLEAAAHIAAAFHAVHPLEQEEVALLPDLITARLALYVAITSWRAALHPENAEYILRNQLPVRANLHRLAQLSSEERVSWFAQRFATVQYEAS
jgi:hydroxylysine kinase